LNNSHYKLIYQKTTHYLINVLNLSLKTWYTNHMHTKSRSLIITISTIAVMAQILLALAIVFVWRIGPVILTLTPTHGVHSGDFLAIIPVITSLMTPRVVSRLLSPSERNREI